MKNSSSSEFEKEKKEIYKDLSYDLLNQIPLLGSLVKSLIKLHSIEQNERFSIFAKVLLQGHQHDAELLECIEGNESKAFQEIFKAVMSDFETEKSEYYGFAYLFIKKHQLFVNNPALAKFIVITIKELTTSDISLIKEVYSFMKLYKSEEAMTYFLKHLQELQFDETETDKFSRVDVRELPLRRASIQKIISCGLLSKIVDNLPHWPTEQFDIIALCIQGLSMEKDNLMMVS